MTRHAFTTHEPVRSSTDHVSRPVGLTAVQATSARQASSQAVRTVDTWFGPPESSLFGSMHIPVSGTARGAVVICSPIAREHIPTYRGLRQLAQLLGRAGFLVLRFDYRGLGDSAGMQSDPEAMDGWLDSVREAVDHVRSCVDAPVSVVGVRAGALLASQVLRDIEPLASLVLLDPVISGRRYVREQRAQYSVMVGEDVAADGRVSFIGGSFAQDTVDRLSSMSLDGGIAAAAAPRVLAVVREADRTGKAVTGLLAASGASCITSSRLETFVNPPSFVFSVPTTVFSEIAEWVSVGASDVRAPVDVAVRHDAAVGLTAEGAPVIETIGYRGPDRLLSFATQAAGHRAEDGVVVLHQTAAEHRIGPARLWVEGGRLLASRGVGALRYDRRGTGDSGDVASEESTAPTSADARDDVRHVAESVEAPAQATVHAGICSGSWHSAFAARENGAAAVVMMNMAKWSFRNTRVPIKAAHVDALDSAMVTRLFRLARAVRNRVHAVRDTLPDPGWRALGAMGLVNAPEVVLGPLAASGARTVTLLSPEDTALFEASRGRSALQRLRRRGLRPEVAIFDRGDHSLYHRDLRETMFEHLLTVVGDTVGGASPTPFTSAAPLGAEKL
ncbi:serine aminopeptidase domain-containing protein [Rhodococcus sp. SORGH_AS_0301]|uniref:serine aminopeptidase domain-containing protein n=1 Tax=Rhodococcus sp. SORGH_AS_0301 TaxID=3041780 RepID=UPI00277EC328|nr:alpha/beta hydrolase [Rhodococcus sp. SORGH_AS_0301]MDQ1181930.1 alpha-beta hydrolase superfamily lysophospholipase [Rhodococcus sp. SORGH_AS_0301]